MSISERPPTAQQAQLLAFIVAFKAEHDGCAPTIRQMQTALGLRSTSGVRPQLEALEKRGYLRLGDFYESRMIQVVGATWTPPVIDKEN